MTDRNDHEAAHAAITDPDRSASAREWSLVDHLTEQHDRDRFGDLPSDPQARERLHDDLHWSASLNQREPETQDEPVLEQEQDLLGLVQAVGSQMEHGDPAYWPDQGMVLVNLIWSRLIHSDQPATLTAATKQAHVMYMDAADRLLTVDRRTAAKMMAQAMGELLSATEEFIGDND